MFAPNSRVDFSILDFATKEPIQFFTQVSEAVFDSNFISKPLEGGKSNWALLVAQAYDLHSFEALLPYMSAETMNRLLPLEKLPTDAILQDFQQFTNTNGSITLDNLVKLNGVFYLNKLGDLVPFTDYNYDENTKLLTYDSTLIVPIIVFGTWLNKTIAFQYSEQIRSKFVSLIIKQELKYIDGKIANLSIYVPKAIIENGMEYLLGSMNKNLAKTPISFIFLKDCSEKITVSIQE